MCAWVGGYHFPPAQCALSVSQLCLESCVVWARPQYFSAAGALGPVPFQKQLAFIAALVSAVVIAAMLLPSSLIRQADVSAGHK